MQFTVTIEVERESGKFASRDEIGDSLAEQVGEIQLDGLGADSESVYNIINVEVT